MERARPNQVARSVWWRDVRRQWPIYTAGLMAMLVTNGTEVLAPKTLQWILDALFAVVSDQGNAATKSLAFDNVLHASALFVGVALLGLLGRVFWRFTLARMTHVAGNSMKQGLWDSMRGASLDHIGRYTLGDLMNRSIGDVNSARWIYGFTMVLSCDVIFFTLLGSASMIAIHPRLALYCLATFLLIPPIVLRLARQEYDAHDMAQEELTTLSEHVSQSVRGVRAQRASNSFSVWVDAMGRSASRYAGLRQRAQMISINSYPLCSVPTILSYAILLFLGPGLVATRQITIGEFAALASYVYLLQGPMAEIGDLVAEWQRGFASLNRIAEIRSLPPAKTFGVIDAASDRREFYHENENAPSEPQSPAPLAVTNLSCGRGGRVLFENVSFDVPHGMWLGIHGSVGCGKSTMFQAIAGLVSPVSGTILYRGRRHPGFNYQRTEPQSGRELVYAPEKPFVFAGTIRHNLQLNQRYSDDELWKVLDAVCLSSEVRNLPMGLDGIVGEGGVALSGGQRQRLALARVALRATTLILLDDPLSAVDVDTESKIIRNLRELWRNKTVLWASNKVAMLECCDVRARLTRDGLRFDSMISDRAYRVPLKESVPHV